MDVEEELRSPVTREELDQMGQEEIERHSDPESEEGIQEWEGITCIREITGMVVMDDKRASQISRALAQGMEPEFVAEVFDIQQREVERILSGAEELKKAHRQAVGERLPRYLQGQRPVPTRRRPGVGWSCVGCLDTQVCADWTAHLLPGHGGPGINHRVSSVG